MTKPTVEPSERAVYYALRAYKESIEAFPGDSKVDKSAEAQRASVIGYDMDGRYDDILGEPSIAEVYRLADTVLKLTDIE